MAQLNGAAGLGQPSSDGDAGELLVRGNDGDRHASSVGGGAYRCCQIEWKRRVPKPVAVVGCIVIIALVFAITLNTAASFSLTSARALRWSTVGSSAAPSPMPKAFAGNSRCRSLSGYRDGWCLGHVRRGEAASPRRVHPLGVALIAYDRPQYLRRVATSLSAQTSGGRNVFVYVDFGEMQDAIVRICQELLPRANITAPKINHGIARITLLAQKDIFAMEAFGGMVLLEEDHLIGPNYLEVIQTMLDASEAMPEVGMVNGKYKELHSIPHDRGCSYQLVKYNSPLNTHNVWAWAVSRAKWTRYIQRYERVFVAAKLHTTAYRNRDPTALKSLIKRMCPGTGYDNWGGQDWLRACAFHASGMPYKFQPTSRYMTYIGKTGMHGTPAMFERAGFPTEPVSRRAVVPVTLGNVCLLEQSTATDVE